MYLCLFVRNYYFLLNPTHFYLYHGVINGDAIKNVLRDIFDFYKIIVLLQLTT